MKGAKDDSFSSFTCCGFLHFVLAFIFFIISFKNIFLVYKCIKMQLKAKV